MTNKTLKILEKRIDNGKYNNSTIESLIEEKGYLFNEKLLKKMIDKEYYDAVKKLAEKRSDLFDRKVLKKISGNDYYNDIKNLIEKEN